MQFTVSKYHSFRFEVSKAEERYLKDLDSTLQSTTVQVAGIEFCCAGEIANVCCRESFRINTN